MKKIMRIPIPSLSKFKIPKRDLVTKFGSVEYRRWQKQWRPHGYDGESKVLNIYFSTWGIRLEIRNRILMLNTKRNAEEIMKDLVSGGLFQENGRTWEMSKWMAKGEKSRRLITLV